MPGAMNEAAAVAMRRGDAEVELDVDNLPAADDENEMLCTGVAGSPDEVLSAAVGEQMVDHDQQMAGAAGHGEQTGARDEGHRRFVHCVCHLLLQHCQAPVEYLSQTERHQFVAYLVPPAYFHAEDLQTRPGVGRTLCLEQTFVVQSPDLALLLFSHSFRKNENSLVLETCNRRTGSYS